MKTAIARTAAPKTNLLARDGFFAAMVGIWIGLGLLKFGNAVILADKIPVPENSLQFILDPWPLEWGYLLLIPLICVGLARWRWNRTTPLWVICLPAAWFAFQLIAAIHTVDSALTTRTLMQFLSVTAAFYLGFCALSATGDLRWFWRFSLGAFGIVLMVGFYQHFIGLEDTRRYFQREILPNYPNGAPPELLKKLASNRIYSTLFYPNTLAAVILLMTPVFLVKVSAVRATPSARMVLLAAAGIGAGGCLLWSGSKAGWLIALGMVAIALSRVRSSLKLRIAAGAAICVLGLAGFLWRYSSYLERGATSASARTDYWRAAIQGFKERPIYGYGPGTFMVTYKRLKSPNSEMARLAHNDYLQQACDSGLPGFLTFFAFVAASLWLLYRRSRSDPTRFAVWLSLVGVSAHGIVEFNLFIPAVAWLQFLLFGWLWGGPAVGSVAPDAI